MIEQILRRAQDPALRREAVELLVRLCQIDTTPNPDVSVMRAAESQCFDLLEETLRPLAFPGAELERRPIDPAISKHAAFSLLHFTKTPRHPEGLSPEATYAGRADLLYRVPGTEGPGGKAGLNAHIDIVAPYVPPRVTDRAVFGRGSCDDKGSVVVMALALKILAECAGGRTPPRGILAMFVIEEETGGNGSLSLALDRTLSEEYDTLLVMECADNTVYPANRGCVWYQAFLEHPAANLFEMFAFVNEELEKEGRALKSESRHPLFPQRPVQTCHGIIGNVGEHPSRICGLVRFQIRFPRAVDAEVRETLDDILAAGLREYVSLYGDKTRVTDPRTGEPKVRRHFDLAAEGSVVTLTVHGSTGHMGSIDENDGAITKMATLVRALVRSRAFLESRAGGGIELLFPDRPAEGALRLEGGQGFVPTHAMEEVMERIRRAAERGAENYLRLAGLSGQGAKAVRVSYDKLHNAAFDGDPDSPAMRHALASAREAGIPDKGPVRGFAVSCDARLFATERPGMPVLTSGPGLLGHAHADDEQLDIDEMMKAVAFLALYLGRRTGLIP